MEVNLHDNTEKNKKAALSLVSNLIDRMDVSDRGGKIMYKLPGNITPNEMRAIKVLYNTIANDLEEPII